MPPEKVDRGEPKKRLAGTADSMSMESWSGAHLPSHFHMTTRDADLSIIVTRSALYSSEMMSRGSSLMYTLTFS
jgi:hypothetical protein